MIFVFIKSHVECLKLICMCWCCRSFSEESFREQLIHSCIVEGSSRFIPVLADLLSQMSQTQRGQDRYGDNSHNQSSPDPADRARDNSTSLQNVPYRGPSARNGPPYNAPDFTVDADHYSQIQNMDPSQSLSSIFPPSGLGTRHATTFSNGGASNTFSGADQHRAQSILNSAPRLSVDSLLSTLPNNGMHHDLSPTEVDDTHRKTTMAELTLNDATTESYPSPLSTEFNYPGQMSFSDDDNHPGPVLQQERRNVDPRLRCYDASITNQRQFRHNGPVGRAVPTPHGYNPDEVAPPPNQFPAAARPGVNTDIRRAQLRQSAHVPTRHAKFEAQMKVGVDAFIRQQQEDGTAGRGGERDGMESYFRQHEGDGRGRSGLADGMEPYFRQRGGDAETESRRANSPVQPATGRNEEVSSRGRRRPGHGDTHRHRTRETHTDQNTKGAGSRRPLDRDSRRHGDAGQNGVNRKEENAQEALAELIIQDVSGDDQDSDDQSFLLLENRSDSPSSSFMSHNVVGNPSMTSTYHSDDNVP